ncbi:MAG: cytochrome P450 [Pirellulaceae bacterium]|nr:cytochrome P450 [Pirellulaceae bacterium]
MTPVRHFPGPRGHWLVGVLPRLRSDMLGFFEQCFREYGDAAYFRAANRRSMLLSHPDDIEQVLVAENRRFIKNYALQFLRPLMGKGLLINEGEDWLRQRRLVQPAFSKSRVESYAPTMTAATERMLAGWQSGQTRDIAAEMLQLTMDIAARALLDVDITGRFRELSQQLEQVMIDVMGRFGASIPLPYWFPAPRNLRLRRTIAKLDATLQTLIDERRAAGIGGGDFLSILMAARDEDDGRGLSDQQLRDEVMTMFLAGHETTANTLAWTWYLLGQHPAWQARVREEVRGVLGGRVPTAADLLQLPLCERVIREAMRLYPPAYVVGRRPVADITIGRHFIPAGTNVLMSQWIVHRDGRWYERPNEFDPDRWADGLAARLPKYAYFPFGGGPRVCIGNTFAMLEAILVLAQVAQQFELELVTRPPVKLLPAITLRPGQPIEIRLC